MNQEQIETLIAELLTRVVQIQKVREEVCCAARRDGYYAIPQQANSASVRRLVELCQQLEDWLLTLPVLPVSAITTSKRAYFQYVIMIGTWAFLWSNARMDLRNDQGARDHLRTWFVAKIRSDRLGNQMPHASVVAGSRYLAMLFHYQMQCHLVLEALPSRERTRGSVRDRKAVVANLDSIHHTLCLEADRIEVLHPEKIDLMV